MADAPKENKAGQAKDTAAEDVAGTTSAVTQGKDTVAPDIETHTTELEVRATAGPLGTHYAVGPDGQPYPVDVAAGSETPAMAIAEVTDGSGAAAGTPGAAGSVVAVTEVVTASDIQHPVVANPGAPEHLRPVDATAPAPIPQPTWTNAKPDPDEAG